MKIQITQEAQKLHPELEPFGCIIIKEPTNEVFSANIKKELTIEKVISLATLLSVHYNGITNHLSSNDSEAIYEEFEEVIGGAQCDFITKLCYYLGLTEYDEEPDTRRSQDELKTKLKETEDYLKTLPDFSIAKDHYETQIDILKWTINKE